MRPLVQPAEKLLVLVEDLFNPLAQLAVLALHAAALVVAGAALARLPVAVVSVAAVHNKWRRLPTVQELPPSLCLAQGRPERVPAWWTCRNPTRPA